MAAKRFVAFISYSHADEGVAARLQKRIETYRLPNRLRARDGDAPSRLGNVFRDRADLAAADSLSDAIRAALADSGALIVLCSPEAAGSQWVDAEIRLFRQLHPGAPVLAAVVRGEPREAMPVALTEDGREPLAADLREEGDGWKLGFLKIIAALAAVPLDALIQRDAQRRIRRVMAVTIAAVLALVATATMMAFAISQRNEAQAQRAEADRRRAQSEGLIEFMVTDLRARLREVGRVDIMRSAVYSAIDSYGEEGRASALAPDSRGQMARLLHAVGEDALNSPNGRDEARRALRRAHAITAPLLADAPRDADRIFNHAQSEYWLGNFSYFAGDMAAVATHWQRYRDLATRLRAVEPHSRRSLQEIAFGDGNLCALDLAVRRDGVAHCQAALATQRALAAAYPEDTAVTISLVNRLSWLSDAVDRRDGPGAGNHYRNEQLNIARRLAAEQPRNWEIQEFLVRALMTVGAAARSTGNAEQSSRLWDEARAKLRIMQAHDPDNLVWRNLATMIE